ncbi:hypothetical protein BO70DRAFT_362380 [Aspergillus heteromorphus CBS 117.55]|uniref:Dickkopf N-terminal cysteine-rich domain-containing protein n=1 Tax=Aspergillus heteromorphus CBS 117.55 TaxID=1448321 RepID=A0A317W797_9EURO|nr:uncharacterized protein BO70DRAFT_362380 [Aspergillus heteromorphus CBS 117.55]PWY81949.1 hypothetical protein BO70DRAFT_362380 [Aspergillus heteromorphus CBS 117.55]
MPRLSTVIVSGLSVLAVAGGASARVLPREARYEIAVPYCENDADQTATVLRRDIEDDHTYTDTDNVNDVEDAEDVEDSGDLQSAPPLCNNNLHCDFGQICNRGRCIAGCNANVDCSRFHTCTNGTCTDSRGGTCAPNRSTCGFHVDCCSGSCKRWGSLFGKKKCRRARKQRAREE